MTAADYTPANNHPVEHETPPMLKLVGISKFFGGIAALKDVNFEVRDGEAVALMGSNGAGKSTIVRIVSGVYSPDEGSLFVEGAKVNLTSPNSARKLGIETVFQNLGLCENIDAAGNFYLGRELYRHLGPLKIMRRKAMLAETRSILNSLDVSVPDLGVATESLSGGQRQAIAFARAAHSAKRLIILDEPTAALGVAESAKVLAAIKQLRTELSLSVLLITHNLEEMRQIADRAVVVRRGMVVADVDLENTDDNQIVSYITGATRST